MRNRFILYIILCCSLAILLHSCKGKASVAIPKGDNDFPAPQQVVATFSKAIEITYPESGEPLQVTTKPLAISQRPTSVFDSTEYGPLTEKPRVVPCTWADTRDTLFEINKLPVKALQIKREKLAVPKSIPVRLTYKGGNRPIYGFDEVLNNTPINAILEDHNGLLWISSDRGLYRYDGSILQHWLPFDMTGKAYGLAETRDGLICLASFRDGIFIIDPLKNQLIRLNEENGLFANSYTRVMADDNGRLWLSHGPFGHRAGITILNLKKQTAQVIGRLQGLPDGEAVGNLSVDKKGRILAPVVPGGLAIIDTAKKSLRILQNIPTLTDARDTMTLSTTAVDEKNRYWMGSVFGNTLCWDPDKGLMTLYGNAQGVPLNFFSFNLTLDNMGRIWRGSVTNNQFPAKGLYVLNEKKESLHVMSPDDGLSSTVVEAFLQDRQGQLWIGTGKGLNMLQLERNPLMRSGNFQTSSILEDFQGKLWVGTLDNGLHVIDPANNRSTILRKKDGVADSLIQYVREIDKEIWISTNAGTDIIDSSRKTITHLGKPTGSLKDASMLATKLADGSVITGGYPNPGFDLLSPDRKMIKQIRASSGFADSGIFEIKATSKGILYTFSMNRGLSRFDPEKRTIQYLKTSFWKNNNLDVLLYIDAWDRCWLGAKDIGLYCISPDADSITRISTSNGLLSNNILSINGAGKNIYVGTSKGLSLIEPGFNNPEGKWHFRSIPETQGLIKQVGSYNSDLITSTGEYWWGDLGITRIVHADSALYRNYPAKTVITRISMFNEDIAEIDSNAAYHPEIIYPIPANNRFPHDRNYIQFNFSRVSIANLDSTRYRYTLEGQDSAWSEAAGNNFSKYYQNLQPGKYTFRVVSTNGGFWSEPAEYQFTILPLWYKTWWAFLIFLSLTGLLIWQIYTYLHNRQLKNENQRLEVTVKERTAELEKSIQDLKETQSQLIQSEKMASLGELTAGIAHEIQNPLNFVNNFAEVSTELATELKDELQKLSIAEKDKGNITGIVDDLVTNQQKINFHGKRADAIVKGMLQHSRINSGQKEPTDLSKLADEYLRLSFHGLRAKDKTFNSDIKTDFAADLPKVNIIPQDIGRVLLNLFTNAFYSVNEKKKKTIAGYEPLVTVSTRSLPGNIEIKVSDNGLGIPRAVVDKIYQPFFTTKPSGQGTGLGLSISYEIITKEHGGSLLVDTVDGESAAFTVLLPV